MKIGFNERPLENDITRKSWIGPGGHRPTIAKITLYSKQCFALIAINLSGSCFLTCQLRTLQSIQNSKFRLWLKQ